MGLPHGTIEQLTTLSDALDGPQANLPVIFYRVAGELAAAVPAFLGLTVTVHDTDSPMVLTTQIPDNPVPIRASLLLSLLPLGATTTTGSVAFYSGTPGAFLALADDVRWIFNLDGRPIIDGELPACPENSTVHGARGPPTRWYRRTRRHRPGTGTA